MKFIAPFNSGLCHNAALYSEYVHTLYCNVYLMPSHKEYGGL